jgi:chromosome segregation ATPase
MKATGKTKVSLLVASVALAGFISCNREDKTTEPKEKTVYNSEEYVSTSEYNDMVKAKNATEDTLYKTINEIDNSLRTVRADQGLIAENGREKYSRKEEILRTISEINALMSQNKEKIKKLSGQLASLRSQRSKWTKESGEMKAFISQKEEEMQKLQQQMGDQATTINYLNQTINELQLAHTSATENAKQLDNELHKAYYALGSYKELKKHNVVAKTGGLLGLGRTEEVKNDFEKGYFTEIDTRKVTTIPVNGKKAKLVTHHPVGSYQWQNVNGNENAETLTITDPEKFWATSRYLVVEVK